MRYGPEARHFKTHLPVLGSAIEESMGEDRNEQVSEAVECNESQTRSLAAWLRDLSRWPR